MNINVFKNHTRGSPNECCPWTYLNIVNWFVPWRFDVGSTSKHSKTIGTLYKFNITPGRETEKVNISVCITPCVGERIEEETMNRA